MSRVLILGGGFGGVSAAVTLREMLSADDEIILVDRQTHFMVGFRKTWAMLEIGPLEGGQRPLKALEARGINVVQGAVTSIEPGARAATIGGQRIEADTLVVALGARHAPEKVAGFSEHVLNAYTVHDLPHVTETLRNFPGGRVLMGIFGTPYQCPPAPYEIALLTKEFFQGRNIGVEMAIFSPKPLTLPSAGKEHSAVLEKRMAEHGIEFLPGRKVASVEQGEVIFEDGRRSFDLALGVPPFVVVDVVRESGLTGDGAWVSVDRNTLETDFEGVYAVGDCVKIPLTGGGQIPKAGLMAEKQGEVVARRIAARLAGREAQATFDGMGACNIEVGGGQAALISGNFYAEPKPHVTMSEMSAGRLAEKRAFEADHLQKWFGS